MKKILSLLAGMTLVVCLFAQAPQKMSYQSVVRKANGSLVVNSPVGIKISVLQSTPTGTVVFAETHNVTTNVNGLASLEIGGGTAVSGIFANINWANGLYFLKTETDPTGGTNYSISGTSQLLSVPYALYSGRSGSAWSLTGNAGTTSSNFIGTTDSKSLRFRVNNITSGIIDLTSNTALGLGSLKSNTTGFSNTAFGYSALQSNVTAGQNTALGFEALYSNTYGKNNVANGYQALRANDFGDYNTATGSEALSKNADGNYNTAVGVKALQENTHGDYNTASGYESLFFNTSGNYNTASGNYALYNNTTGDNNASLGYFADVSVGNLDNAIAIGSFSIVNASNKIVLGNTSMSAIGGYAPWSNFSDGRFKENIQENVPGLNFINRLHPVTYTLNTQKIDEHIMHLMPDSIKARHIQTPREYARTQSIVHTGFIAQEVERTAGEIGYRFDGVNAPTNPTDNYSLSYGQFVVPLVKAAQELSTENAQLKTENQQQSVKIEQLQQENHQMKAEIQLIKEKLGLK